MESPAIDHRSIGVLGVLTICAYGSWYYSFGVLLDPIRLDTGWRESTLTASFSAGTVLVGSAALFGGRMLDRVGHRPVFLLGAAIGGGGLLVASIATSVAVFFVGAAVGLGACGALGFYHVSMTTVVRLNPERSDRAIAVLTIWGAFASAIFLPLTDALESWLGWRPATRILAAVTTAAFGLAAITLPSTSPQQPQPNRPSIRQVLISTVSEPAPRLLTMAVASGGFAMATLLVYQVPVMTAAGLASGTAATMAGIRGFCQLGGRLPLSPIVARIGADRALMLAFGAILTGAGLLAISSTVAVAAAFAVVAGFGIGAFSPLQGIRAALLFDRDRLGATMGVYGAVLVLAGSLGPFSAGFIVEATGERRWAAALAAAGGLLALLAATLLSRLDRAGDRVAATATS